MSNIFHIYFVRIPICLSQLFKMKCDGFYTGYGLETEDLDVNDESRARPNIFCIIPYRENMSCKNLVTLSGEMSQVHAQLYTVYRTLYSNTAGVEIIPTPRLQIAQFHAKDYTYKGENCFFISTKRMFSKTCNYTPDRRG